MHLVSAPSPCLLTAIANCVLPPLYLSKYMTKKLRALGVSLSSNFTWTEHIEYISTKINQRLGLKRRNKSLLPRSACILFFNSLILPVFDYADNVWGDKDNAVLMNNLPLLQNKAAKTILDRPFHSSATDALEALGWLTLEKRRLFHRWLYVYKCVNEISAHSMDLLANNNNNNNNKLYLHDHNKVLQYCKSYLKLLIDSL